MADICFGNIFTSTRVAAQGVNSISGIVDEAGVPGSYEVYLGWQPTKKLLKAQWAATDGSFLFEGLSEGPFFLMVFDHGEDPVNAAIEDNKYAASA